MSTVNCGFPDVPEDSRRLLLVEVGPTVPVRIGYDPGFDETSGSEPILPPELHSVLVDTGANGNSIDIELAAQLRLPVYEYGVSIAGSVGEHTTDIYLAQIYIPDLNRTIGGQFTGVNLAGGNQLHRAIIGRSFLQDFTLHYDERTGEVTMSDE